MGVNELRKRYINRAYELESRSKTERGAMRYLIRVCRGERRIPLSLPLPAWRLCGPGACPRYFDEVADGIWRAVGMPARPKLPEPMPQLERDRRRARADSRFREEFIARCREELTQLLTAHPDGPSRRDRARAKELEDVLRSLGETGIPRIPSEDREVIYGELLSKIAPRKRLRAGEYFIAVRITDGDVPQGWTEARPSSERYKPDARGYSWRKTDHTLGLDIPETWRLAEQDSVVYAVALDGRRAAFPRKGRGLSLVWDVIDLTDPQVIRRVLNVEHRRIAVQLAGGPDAWLRALGAEPVHADQYGELYRVRGRGEYMAYVRVRCPSTGRVYTLQVPPFIGTARRAVAWTFGLREEEYVPSKES